MEITNKEDILKGSELILKYVSIVNGIVLFSTFFFDYSKKAVVVLCAFNMIGIMIHKGVIKNADKIAVRGKTYGKKLG